MSRHVRNLRHALHVTGGTGDYDLLTIGYLARAVGRTPWTILYWQRIGLLPPAPFVINANKVNIRRRLYPARYVAELARLMNKHYPSPRLERVYWSSFKKETSDAYRRHVQPLIGDGVMPPVEIVRLSTGTWSRQDEQDPSSATSAQNVTYPAQEENASEPLIAV
jgi:hypothetical protein